MVAFLLSLSLASVSAQEVEITPAEISIIAYAGDFAESFLSINNDGSERVLVEVSSIRWETRDVIPEIERGYVRIEPRGRGYLRLRGYIDTGSEPGFYDGEVIIKVDGEDREIPIKLEIIRVIEDVGLALEIELDSMESKPGGVIVVKSTIHNLVQRRTGTHLEVLLKDQETGSVLVRKEGDNVLSGGAVLETSYELTIPGTAQDKEYEVSGVLYYTENGNMTEMASDVEKITVRRSIFDSVASIISQITAARIVLGFFLLVVVGILALFYRRYKRERERRLRYLKSISFDMLPEKGPKTGFIGKVAETHASAYFYLDSLTTHTLIAGRTGCGKTIAAQILVEEALAKRDIAVIVFDPTAQWTGFLEENKDDDMFKRYGKYKMKLEDARGFKGNIYVIKEATERINTERHIVPGEISVFYMEGMNNPDIETFMSNAIDDIFAAGFTDSPELKVIVIFDEVHRILPKFGGVGKGFVQIERAVREFRRFGIGVILISQVLKDFIGQIRANIGTEIQMHTRYKEDLDRINLKYGDYIYQSVVKADTGEGMLQNSDYNKGNPYFVSFRPVLHNAKSLSSEKLEQYEEYNKKLNDLLPKLETLKKAEMDTFDIELEMNLAFENVKRGSFEIVDLYISSLSGRIGDYLEKLETGKVSDKDKAIKSEWDARRDKEIRAYEIELNTILDKEEKKVGEKEKILKEKQEETIENIGREKERLKEEEEGIMKELEAEKVKLKSRAQVLDLLKKHKEIKILREEVTLKEKEKLRIGEEKLKQLSEMRNEQLDKEKRRQAEEEQRLRGEAMRKEEALKKVEQMIGKRREMITKDKEMIVEKDKKIGAKEERIAEGIVGEIRSGVEKRVDILGQAAKEEDFARRESLEKKELGLEKMLEEARERKKAEAREERKGIVGEKDRLHEELTEIKSKWAGILEREVEITEKEGKLEERREELQEKTGGKELEDIREGDVGWNEFRDMEEEWRRMDEMREEKESLEKELSKIREELMTEVSHPAEEKVPKAAPGPESITPNVPESSSQDISGEDPADRIRRLKAEREECNREIEGEKKKISELESKGEGWEIFEQMEIEWKRMDELRAKRESIERDLREAESGAENEETGS